MQSVTRSLTTLYCNHVTATVYTNYVGLTFIKLLKQPPPCIKHCTSDCCCGACDVPPLEHYWPCSSPGCLLLCVVLLKCCASPFAERAVCSRVVLLLLCRSRAKNIVLFGLLGGKEMLQGSQRGFENRVRLEVGLVVVCMRACM